MCHESMVKRDPSEITSSLLLFSKENMKKGAREFSFYLDSCPQQNNHKYLFFSYNNAVQKDDIEIQPIFLEKEYNRNEGDFIHLVRKFQKWVVLYFRSMVHTRKNL